MSKVMSKQGEFCWNELLCNDPASAKEFYGALLGWQCNDIDMGDKTYTIFTDGDKEVGGLMQIPQEVSQQVPPHWMSYIAVDDLTAMIKKAQSLGASVKVPDTQVANLGRLAVISDPSGATIALWQSLNQC